MESIINFLQFGQLRNGWTENMIRWYTLNYYALYIKVYIPVMKLISRPKVYTGFQDKYVYI